MSCKDEFEMIGSTLKTYRGESSCVVVPKGVAQIGYGAFRNHPTLREIILPSGVKRVDSHAFSGCIQLENVELPESLESIGYHAFAECSKLKKMRLPEGLCDLSRMAFWQCIALKEFIFPESLQNVGKDAFEGTAWLKLQEDGIVYAGTLAVCVKGTINNGIIREGTKKLCENLFREYALLKEIILPDTLLEIGDRAFQNCRQLHEVRIPSAVQRIGVRAFYGCDRLHISLEGKETLFGRDCFSETATVHVSVMNPSKLPKVVQNSAILAFAEDYIRQISMDTQFFMQCTKYIRNRRKLLYPIALQHWSLLQFLIQSKSIPLEDVSDLLEPLLLQDASEAAAALLQYKQQLTADFTKETTSAEIWDDLDWDFDVEETDVNIDSEKEWGVKNNADGTLTLLLYRGKKSVITVPSQIAGTSVTALAPAVCSPERYGIKAETAAQRNSIREVVLQEGILSIGNHAFAGCKSLERVVLPESIIEIGYEAFRDCKKLFDISIPPSVEHIGRDAFAGCPKIKNCGIIES